MKQKEDNPIKTLFEFSGDAKGKMSLSVILTVLSELFGMLPYLTAAMLANEVFAGTATIHSTLIWAGIAADCIYHFVQYSVCDCRKNAKGSNGCHAGNAIRRI